MWNQAVETMPREEMRQLQSERLIKQVKNVYQNVPFYRQRLDEHNIKPEDISSIDDLAKLPFTTKQDMRDVFPDGLFAVAKSEIVEIHTSSGTTGTPVVAAYTRNDMEMWSESMARCLAMCGLTNEDVVQNGYGYGFFTGGLGVHIGSHKIGAMTLPISAGNTRRQIETMRDFSSTAITCTPSYALYLCEAAKEMGISVKELPLKVGLFGAEPWSETMRKDIEEKLGIKAFDIYGLTEVVGPGVGNECCEQNGLHICEDHFYPEIIDPETGNVLPDGEKGELVFTTLSREGTPVIRYRTRDITYIMTENCSCGRTSRKIHRLMGRNDDMLIIRGVNVFPTQIEEVLLRIDGVEPHYQLIIEREGVLDTLEVQVEMSDELVSDEIKVLVALEKSIQSELKSLLQVQAKVTLVNPKTIQRSEGKAKRIIDNREIKNKVQ